MVLPSSLSAGHCVNFMIVMLLATESLFVVTDYDNSSRPAKLFLRLPLARKLDALFLAIYTMIVLRLCSIEISASVP